MSLLSDAMTTCYHYEPTETPDGYGGSEMPYKKGSEFKAAIVFDTSIEARRADNEGVRSLYTITTSRTELLKYHDVFMRASDGKVFRVTSDGDDKFTPQSTNLDMRQVTAEEWSIPSDE